MFVYISPFSLLALLYHLCQEYHPYHLLHQYHWDPGELSNMSHKLQHNLLLNYTSKFVGEIQLTISPFLPFPPFRPWFPFSPIIPTSPFTPCNNWESVCLNTHNSVQVSAPYHPCHQSYHCLPSVLVDLYLLQYPTHNTITYIHTHTHEKCTVSDIICVELCTYSLHVSLTVTTKTDFLSLFMGHLNM